MTWLLLGAGVVVGIVVFTWAAAKIGRRRDPYASLGPVHSHRETRPDLHLTHREDR